MSTDEIANELAGLVRWEPGMVDVDGDRVMRLNDFGDVDIGYVTNRGEVDWHPQAYMHCPNLTDDSTLDVLWGQLRRRFAACGWDWFDHRTRSESTVMGAAGTREHFEYRGDPATVLLAGYRRVVGLEREVEARDGD